MSSIPFRLVDHKIDLCTGHWLFTQLLLPALFAATDASPSQEKARVVTVSSFANHLTTGLDFDAITDGPERTKYGEWELYNKSKFVCRTILLLISLFADPSRRVTLLWRASWRGGTATRLCPRASIQVIFVRIFRGTFLGGRKL